MLSMSSYGYRIAKNLGALGVLALLMLEPRPVAAAKLGPVARISRAQGAMLRAQPNAAWEPAIDDAPILPGTFIKTETSYCELKMSDGASVVLEPLTVAQVQAPTEVNLEVGPTTRVSRVDVKVGNMRVAIPQGSRPLLVMASKDVFAAFRPGRGRIRMLPDGLIAVVDEGSARVAASGRWTPLMAGQFQVLRTHAPQGGARSLPPVPTFVSEPCHAEAPSVCAIAVAVGAESAPVGVRWNPSNAHQWVVSLARDPELLDVISTQKQDREKTSFATGPLSVGRYWLGVRPVTEEGIEGPLGLRALRVVRLLPEAGVEHLAAHPIFVLPPGRRVKVDSLPGLQVSLGGAAFGPAPPYLQLQGDDQLRAVRMRVEGDSTDDVTVTLERRALRADVELTPRNARWPRDPVGVTVRLVDPRQRIALDSVHPRLRVLLNNTPQQVPLVKQGVVWRGAIRPRNGFGPWVVRVEVLDHDDNVLGRSMLEVVGQERPGQGRSLW
jgi:hypothetical protein